MTSISPVAAGALASLAAGMMTGLGALPVLFGRQISKQTQDVLLGFAAGVMLAATAFSLVLPGVEAGAEIYGNRRISAVVVGIGILLGGWFLAFLNQRIPHEHFVKGLEGADPGRLKGLWLFVIAITLHNFPEGVAVGVGFGGGFDNGLSLAIGIGLQNAPEGLAVAVALLSVGYSRQRSFMVALLTGLVEPVGGLAGAAALAVATVILPVGLALAAGAMLFVISNEIIPETHRKRSAVRATGGVMVGFVLMMVLDIVFAG